nr:amidohydrolase family protein [Phytoactinopolyspora alkaliphila]
MVLPQGIRDGLAVVVEERRITAVRPRTSTDIADGDADSAQVGHAVADRQESGTRVVDVGGRLITPGLIDLHVHGGWGMSFDRSNQPGGSDAVPELLRRFARAGVTSIQASLVSAEVDELAARLDAIAAGGRVHRDASDGAELLGVHLEGPFLTRAQCGAHDPAVLRAPSSDDVAALLEHSGSIAMITLAPELPGAVEAVRRFAEAGVVVAAGHSESSPAELAEAASAGLSHITHLWSGQSSVTRKGPWRVPGLLEASLASNSLTAEVIADGRHLPAELLEIARRCLGERLIVVSDGTEGTGMPSGYRYDLGTVRCEVGDGVGVVIGADAFGGSTTTVAQMLEHLCTDLGWPVTEVVAMATSRAADVAGVGARKGTIAVGMDADLAVFDPGFSAWGTMLRGHWLSATAA